MSKTKARVKNEVVVSSQKSKRRLVVAVLVLLAVSLCFAGAVASWNTPSAGTNVRAVFVPAPPPTPLPLAKEYIYAGSKLIATEERANAAPTVTLTSPASNFTFTAGTNLLMAASASDTDGTISQVQIYQGSTLLGTATPAGGGVYNYTWTNVTAGNYALTAKATDDGGATTNSASVNVIANALPTVNLTSPANNFIFTAGSNLAISMSAGDADGTVSQVQVYQGATLLGTATAAGNGIYNYTWSNVTAGNYSLTAKATDNRGAVTNSAAINVIANALPAASITSPTNNSTFTAGTNLAITVSASDADGTVSQVQVYQGTTLLGTATAAGGGVYNYTWNNVTAGAYSLTAKATDNRGALTTSTAVNVSSNPNNAPSASITVPASNFTFAAGSNLSISVTAADADGTISQVQIYQGATLLGAATAAGNGVYNYTWLNVAAGSYNLTAKATDNLGAITTSTAISIIANALPTASITGPANNFIFPSGSNLPISVTAADADGTISQVQVYQGATLLGAATAAGGGVYNYTWPNVAYGSYVLTAKATDNRGAITTSANVNVISNAPPTVSITLPATNTIFTTPASITLNASASDADGTISQVQFYQGTTLIGTATAPPFTATWPNVAYNSYSLTAKATDNYGATTTSGAVNVIVNSPPAVQITSPQANTMFSPAANIVLDASASDLDGTITQVEFFQGTTLIGTDTTTPFSITWSNVGTGIYSLTARATDNRGTTTTSSAINITTPTFRDDFNDNSLDLGKWYVRTPASPATVSEQNQQLRITLPPSTATYNGIGSNALYDMRGGTAQVELVQAVSQAGWVENTLSLEGDGLNYLLINAGAGSILFRSSVGGSFDQLIIPYDPVAHRYWRIRHNLNTNTLSFETSANGANWTSRKTVTAGFSMTALRFVLIAGAWGTGNATPGAAIYNDFQYIPDPSLPSTPSALLSDDFNDNSLDASKWIHNDLFSGYTNTDVPINETLQRLEIGPLLQNVNGSSYRGIRSVSAYNFTGAYSYVEVLQAPAATTNGDAMLTIGNDVNAYYRIYVSHGNLIGVRKIAPTKTTLFTVPYDLVNHRYLRIRHDAVTGSVTLDTAANNSGAPGPWVQRYSEAWNASVSLGAIIFEVKGGTWQLEATAPDKVIFDNFRAAVNGS